MNELLGRPGWWCWLLVVSMAVTSASGAKAQADPFAGLDPAIRTVGNAIGSGDPASVLPLLSAESLVKTAYPGDGETVPRSGAEAEVPEALVSSPGMSDVFGTGAYRLIAVWISSTTPGEVLLMGSGIDANGKRRSTVFGVENTASGWRISSWGPVLDTASTLSQWEKYGDLRLVTALPSPLPPSTGSTQEPVRIDSGKTVPVSAVMAAIGIAATAVCVVGVARRRVR